MATTAIDFAQALSPEIKATLRSLRGRIRAYIWAEGVTLVLTWLGTAFWLGLALDWFFEPPMVIRLAFLAATAIVALWLIGRYLVSRLTTPLADHSMAVVLERRFRHLDDSLLTAVWLTENSLDPEKCNPLMLSRTCEEAAERIRQVRVAEVFNPLPLRRSTAGAIFFAASIALFFGMFPEAAQLWLRRGLLLSAEQWPRQSRFLEVVGVRDGEEQPFVDGVLKVARGAELTLLVRADTAMPRVPASVELRYRPEGGSRQRKLMAREGRADPEKDRFQQYSYQFEGALAPIAFEVVDLGPSGDHLYNYRIEVVDSPSLMEMNVECRFPDYTERSSRTLPVTGAMQFPLGSTLTLRATANKPLRKIRVESVRGSQPAESAELSGDVLGADGQSLTLSLPPLEDDTTLFFHLFDVDGIRSREPVRVALAVQMDEPPQVRVRLFGIGTAVTPSVRIPFEGRIIDDFGTARVWAETVLDHDDPVEHQMLELPRAPSDLAITAETALDAREMKLLPGQKMQLILRAADRFQWQGQGPNVGQSERWQLDIVTPEQLRAMLEARELVLRQRFEVIINEASETRDMLLKVNFDPGDEDRGVTPGDEPGDQPPKEDGKPVSGKPSPDGDKPATEIGAEPGDAPRAGQAMSAEKHLALQTMRVQRALQNARKNAAEVKGVAESFDDILAQMVNNRIDTEELRQRIDVAIARPLHGIADEMFPTFQKNVELLQELISDVKRGPAARRRALTQAEDILAAMLAVRAKMIELEDFNEAIEMLRTIIKQQEQLEQATKQRQKEKLRELMED